MKHHKLALKKGDLMKIARKSVTSESFVIYGFYELLEAEVKLLGLENCPECIWDCDETGFPWILANSRLLVKNGKKQLGIHVEQTDKMTQFRQLSVLMELHLIP